MSGCTTQEQAASVATADQALAREMSADSLYMKRMFASQPHAAGISGSIDLTDPAQYRFMMNRLAAGGKTPENAPELFSRLQNSRNVAVAKAKAGISTNAVASDWCTGYILPGTEVKSGTSIVFSNTRPVVSCLGGSDYVYFDVFTFDFNLAGTEGIFVAGAAGEDFTGEPVLDWLSISPVMPAVLGRINYTDSYAVSYDPAGVEQFTYFAIATGVVQSPPVPGSIALAHPRIHSWISNGGFIEMCQLRGSPTQCDYAVGNLTGATFTGWTPNASGIFTGIAGVATNTGTATVPWAPEVASYVAFPTPYNSSHIYLPTIGTLDVGATAAGDCRILSVDSATFNLIKATTGGACSTAASFKDKVVIGANPRTASFRTISDFTNDGGTASPPSANCSLSSIINEGVKPAILVRTTANCGGVVIPRIAATAPGGGPALSENIFFLNSCLAEGTGIRRSDGSSVAVEKIKAGDKVIADAKGTVLTVTGVSHGGENEPIVELRDDKGHKLRATAKHPLIKASGEVVFASTIVKGDRVMTDRGIAVVTSVNRIPYNGTVYNLKLGTADEQAKVGKDGTTMFADGFLVGDSSMQKAHDTPARREVAQLPKEWQRDRDASVANGLPRVRLRR